ncbi:MAG: D-alanine--D-alanine ligase [Bacteroidota bacterium]|nr:D-alanine--D-alanine ligase [Bacteroidota bacterium]MDP4191027.1 D-alanine--D-alanine ligase [Bacteroidota bacterium]MDP4196221.1 D-alanine--D-alanine ligase [Bacteroidota bacterium]
MKNIKDLNIALLLGGTSTEREVSKSSSKAIYYELKSRGFKVKLIDPAYGLNQPTREEDFFSSEDFAATSNRNCITAINSDLLDNIDIAFLGLHGKWGEDGTIQSLLELRGIKYTGSGVLASSLAMDKAMTKIMFQHYDVVTPKWFVVSKNENDFDLVKAKINQITGYPCIIKPNDQGSTIGLTVCEKDEDVEHAVKLAVQYSDKALIEEFIPGHEVTVGVLENQALPVLEIKPKHDHYDYECKYTSGMSQYIVPAELPDEVSQRLQKQSLLAFQALGCTGYGRIDFRVTSDFKSYCLEANTLPGMTGTSLVPKMAKAVGISFGELLEKIIELAL